MKDATLGGYLREHERPPAFEAGAGDSYTVEIITNRMGLNESGLWGAYLFFLKWSGQEPVGHVESEFLSEAETEEEARAAVEELTLHQVKSVLDRLIE